MNILAHVQERLDRATKQIVQLDAKRGNITQRIADLQRERTKVESASQSAVAAGLKMDEQATETRLGEFSAQISALHVELKLLDKEKADAVADREALKPLGQLSQLCREQLELMEIPELGSTAELHALLQARLVFEEDEVTACQLWLGDTHRSLWEITLPIKSSTKRIRRGVVPEALKWVPDDWLPVKPSKDNASSPERQSLLPTPQAEPAQLYYIVDEDEFRSLMPALTWQENEVRQAGAHWERRTETVRVTKQAAWGAPEDCLTAYLTEAFAEQVVNLDAVADAEVLPGLREAILAATQPADEVVYTPTPEMQTMPEIEKSIGKQLRAFVDAPWTPDTRGLLANFKYYCEQGERPRFHNLPVAGAYGFRLRTRDHSWIKGFVYVVPENLTYDATQTKVPEIKSDYGSSRHLRLGRLIMKIEDESRD